MIPRFVEPDRPKAWTELPYYDRAAYWYAMYRAVSVKSANVIEVARYEGQRIRSVAFFLTILTLFINIAGPINSWGSWGNWTDQLKDDFKYVFFFEDDIREQYKERIAEGWQEDRTEDEYVESFKNNPIHSNRFFTVYTGYLILWSMPLASIGIMLFWPQKCPVRFDRNRRIAFTWEKDILYVADARDLGGPLPGFIKMEMKGNPMYEDTRTGSYGLDMVRADGQGTKLVVKMGPHPVCHAHQNRDLNMFIDAFMSPHLFDENMNRIPWTGDWLQKLRRGRLFPLHPLRWMSARTLGRKHRFDEEKTEMALLEYLTR